MPKTFTKAEIEEAIKEADAISCAACTKAADERYGHPEAVEIVKEANIRAMRIYQDALRGILGLKGFKETINPKKEEHEESL